jgi:Rrf2 family protein
MIYSRSAEYAIRAFVHLSQTPPGKYAMARQIADETGIPAHFLAKILQQLAKQGMLKSSKGPTGGFSLRQAPEEISLLSIVEAIDGLADYQRCISGMAECSDQTRCGQHDQWKALRGRIMDYLRSTSVSDVADALESKKKQLSRQRGGSRGTTSVRAARGRG